MKTRVLFIILVLIASTAVSNDLPYQQAMKTNIAALNKAKSVSDFQQVANRFERIAISEKAKWLPYYYASLSYILLSMKDSVTDKDGYLDKAQIFIDSANSITQNQSELISLQGFLYQGRIMVDIKSRGMKYSMKAGKEFSRAEAVDPNNPRVYYLTGMNLVNTPRAFGGGKKNALEYFSKAKEKFDSFAKTDELMPDWGNEENEKMIAFCSENK